MAKAMARAIASAGIAVLRNPFTHSRALSSVMVSASSDSVAPGAITVTRMLEFSMRSPSEIACTAKAGYGVWIDRQAHGSQRYAAPIVRAIKSSQLVALMCSQNAFASDHVTREVYVAGDCKKPFIVFQLDPAEFPDELRYFVSGFQHFPVDNIDWQQLRLLLEKLIAD